MASDDSEWQPSDALFDFLDNCLIRLAKKTVKYDQDLLRLRAEVKQTAVPDEDNAVGGLLMVILEQWPFIQRSSAIPDAENISHWLTRFLLVVARNGGDLEFIACVRGKIESLTMLHQCLGWLKKGPDGHFMEGNNFQVVEPPSEEAPTMGTLADRWILEGTDAKEEWQPPTPPASEGDDHPALGKWKQLGIEEAIVEGAIGELILCLCSQYADIRRQAVMELRSCMKALQVCTPPGQKATSR